MGSEEVNETAILLPLIEESASGKNYDATTPGKSYKNSPSMMRKAVSADARVPIAPDMGRQEQDEITPLAAVRTASAITSKELEERRSQANMLLLDELQLDTVNLTMPLVFAVLVATLSQFLVGYNTGVMNAPAAVVFPGHSTGLWSLAVATFALGGPFGAIIAGSLADSRGRRGALLINTWTFILGGLIQTFAVDMFSIVCARFTIGFASGFSSVLVPIYLGEVAPPTLRGRLGTLTQFALVLGILASDLLAFPLATRSRWRLLFSVTEIVAFIQLFCAPWLLESPRWLLSRDPNNKKARSIIRTLRGMRYDHEIEAEVNHFLSTCRAQQSSDNSSGFIAMINDKSVRILVVSCIILQVTQQLCGINAVFYYSTTFFDGVIANPLAGTTLVGAVNVIATYIALLLMDSCGRRVLVLLSSGGMALCCVVLTLSLLGVFENFVALAAVNVYVTFFEIGLGPIPWLIVAEMFNAKYVTTAMSVSCLVNWACNFIVGLVFPFMNEYLGPYSFVPFAVILSLAFIFVLIWLPETRGLTPDEVQDAIAIKKSSSYDSMSVDVAQSNPLDFEWRKAMDKIRKDEEEAMKSGQFDYGFQPIAS